MKGKHGGGGGGGRRAFKTKRRGAANIFRFNPERNPTPSVLKDIALAQQLYDAGDWDACEPVIRRFLQRPAFRAQPMTYDALGSCAQFQGRMNVAIECFRKALEIDPHYVEAHNRIVMILDADPETTPEVAQAERDLWWRLHGMAPFGARMPHLNSRDPDRPIRVGYVSGDFQFHSAATVFHRIARCHSAAIEPFYYSSTPYKAFDHVTKAYVDHPGWRDIVGWPDPLVAAKIRQDQIDILIDLSGYTAHNRLITFCFKPAPIQLTGWGYATGVGWPAMDGLIADRVVVPEDRQCEHVERMVYLPCIIDYEGTHGLPDPNPLPCLTQRPTFGVFQRSLKINADDVGVWRQILERLPESRLIMKGLYCPSLMAQIREWFGAQIDQVEFRGLTSSVEHKTMYAEVDLSLDTWPQTAGVSACDSLWMGVPEVTLIGPRVIQRTTASLLTNLGLTEFITETREQYIETAVSWVTERKQELADIRLNLRKAFIASPIHDGYVERVEEAYKSLWHEWCAKPLTLADAAYRLEQAS